MLNGINTNSGNYYRGIQSQKTSEVAKTNTDTKESQTLDDFKRDIYDTINKMQVHPSQSGTQISVSISDKAFEKMMNDPEYKQEMLGVIQRDLNGAYPAAWAPSYSSIRIGDDCEYVADAFGSSYGDRFSALSANSFWEKNTNKTASSYNERRNKQKSFQDMVEQRLLERRLLEKASLEKKAAERVK